MVARSDVHVDKATSSMRMEELVEVRMDFLKIYLAILFYKHQSVCSRDSLL